MLKKLLLAFALSCLASSAYAVCGAIPLPILDGTGASRNLSSATAADGNCKTYIDADTGSQLHSDMTAPIPPQTSHTINIGAVDLINPYPGTAVPLTNSATGTTLGAVATLAGAASVTNYICGFSVRANATAATTINLVVSGTIGGSMNFTEWVAPLASGLGIAEMIFHPCVPASAANTSIVVTGGAPGAGGTNSATAWGFKL